MQAASKKALSDPALVSATEDQEQASPQYRVLRSGKRILATPGLKKAARIAVTPAPSMITQAARVAVEQV